MDVFFAQGTSMRHASTAVAILVASTTFASPPVTVTRHGSSASIQNGLVRVDYDLARGTFSLIDERHGGLKVVGARSRWGSDTSDDARMRRTSDSRSIQDALGSGMALRIACRRKGGPSYLLDLALYKGSGRIVLECGVKNGGTPLRVLEFQPLAGGRLISAHGIDQAKTLDGVSGASQTEVLSGFYRTSKNNVLLTFADGGVRRSVVIGGLTYHEFCKSAAMYPANSESRPESLGRRGRLAGYCDCGTQPETGTERGLHVERIAGDDYAFPGDPATPWFNTVAFDAKEVVYDVAGLKPDRDYTLGFSWWDEDGNGRRESVWVEPGDGSGRLRLVGSTLLPAWKGKRLPPQELTAAIPRKAAATGRCRIVFANDADVPNAVVSEVWLWEGPVRPPAPLPRPEAFAWTWRRPTRSDGSSIRPTWIPDDRFYLDITTDDPFEALESYGRCFERHNVAGPTLTISQPFAPGTQEFGGRREPRTTRTRAPTESPQRQAS